MFPDCTFPDSTPTAGALAQAALVGWDALPDATQLHIAHEAMVRAGEMIACLAQVLAAEIENGAISDRGAPEALRLFARIVRVTGRDLLAPAGSA